jgi:hypothetical protein
MSNFFDIRARKQEAAASGSSSKKEAPKEHTHLQPWVEK